MISTPAISFVIFYEVFELFLQTNFCSFTKYVLLCHYQTNAFMLTSGFATTHLVVFQPNWSNNTLKSGFPEKPDPGSGFFLA